MKIKEHVSHFVKCHKIECAAIAIVIIVLAIL
jgi:hypothetical protein